MDLTPQEFIELIASFGAAGVLGMWLRWTINKLSETERALERTQAKYEDTLRDCNRREDDTRRFPPIPEAERAAWRKKYQDEEPP